MRPVKLDTVFAIRGKHAVAAYCVACRRHAWVDLARVVETWGAVLPLARLKQRLTCERCGRRGAEMRLVYHPGRCSRRLSLPGRLTAYLAHRTRRKLT